MKVGLEIKYTVIFSYFFVLRRQWKFSINPFLCVLVPIQCISVSYTLAAHLVFLSYICFPQNPFKGPKITESDE